MHQQQVVAIQGLSEHKIFTRKSPVRTQFIA